MNEWGEFESDVKTIWEIHSGPDRKMKLLEDLLFRDNNKKMWSARSGQSINGASIPQIFWSTYPGSPYIGDYRRAAVLHDALYSVKYDNDRKTVDRVFYKAMRADNTDWLEAAIIFIAVRIFGGPAWEGEEIFHVAKGAEEKFRDTIEWVKGQGEGVSMDEIDSECDMVRDKLKLPD